VMLTNLILVAGAIASGPTAPDGKPTVEWTAPESFMGAGEFVVHVVLTGSKDTVKVPAWLFEGSAFTVNGKPLGEKRSDAMVTLLPNAHLALDLDLGGLLATAKGVDAKDFKLGYAKDYLDGEEKGVRFMQAVEKGLDFMKMPVEDLSKYHVIMSTNRGDMEMEFWPDVAPNHVRNFLDLCYTGFYDGKIFHRVIPGFMIQGGDPTGTGSGSGPRMLKAEFSSKKHEAGVLSMARSQSPDSGSCQFFVMHKASPSLDGQYSAFGKLVSGLDVVDKIVNSKRNSQDKPFEPQTIMKCTVVRSGGK
jgi:peptidyl-prolyl cis-trans isomerase B (cyclophilin B)